ncbi:amidohydrolase [Niastella koreensis]|uniref:Amidohydrolase 2 n=2 Tax=Niastella koreensis TaxID=354356 RepID=G8TNL0_NIAKG|nr:amidohydrolase family protein [Niastella koreensis]AEV99927.1 amidohydrolase 2 [Niastella koreensis GR20-10]OQP51466.1 amidohydrolase [Niastella koreensis]
MEIIDAHVHIWNFEKAEYDWLKNDTSILNRNYEIEELTAEVKNTAVTGGVLVQAANTYEETNYMLQVANATGWIKGVVGWMPLQDPAFTATAIREYLSNPYFKGVRHLIHDEPDPQWLLQPTVIQSLSVLAAYDIPYDVVGVTPQHLITALEVAQKVPELRLMLDHMNQPPIASGEKFGEWGELMKAAASHKNFYVKISGLGTCAKKGPNWTAGDIQPYIEFVLEHFGENRCCCGGDWPVSLLADNYTNTWQHYVKVLSGALSDAALQKVLNTNAVSFYNL